MKIYVSADLEGIAGIVQPSQLSYCEPHYQEARRLLTSEVNAVVEGLLQNGVDEVIVKDAHASGFNFLIEDLHPGATYCFGGTPIDQRFPGLDSSFDGAMLIGYHGMAGTTRAILDHTFSSQRFTRMELNGQQIGEIGIDGLLFGLFEVPLLFVSGDDKTCAEAKRDLGSHVTTYQTKTSYGRHSALTKPPRKVNEEIKGTLGEAIANKGLCHPLKKQGPYELIVRYTSTGFADACHCDGVKTIRLDELSILFKDTDLVQLFMRAI